MLMIMDCKLQHYICIIYCRIFLIFTSFAHRLKRNKLKPKLTRMATFIKANLNQSDRLQNIDKFKVTSN